MHSLDVLIVEDDAPLRQALCNTLEANDFSVCSATDGREALSMLDKTEVGVVLSDINMAPMDGRELLSRLRQRFPMVPAVMMTAYGTIEQAVDAMRDGASDYLVKPVDVDGLLDVIKRHVDPGAHSGDIVADDPVSKSLLSVARRVAGTDATVTISGESGSGKEVVARYIHTHSSRAEQPFVAINCAAIPENMLEAVLFGYEKGAFTGAAAAHPGKFEQAQGGTLLLDEISEMDIALQAKLLRVIQEREVERIGGRKIISLDVRVLATTNRDLRRYVSDGRFREDLYYRLNVFPLEVQPLRERRGDVLPLFRRGLARHHQGAGPAPVLTADSEQRLLAHDWPGNVRELDNLVQRTLIMLPSHEIRPEDLVFESLHSPPDETSAATQLQDNLRHREQQVIIDALEQSNGNRKAAAAALGVSPRTLRYKLARLREEGVFPASPQARGQ